MFLMSFKVTERMNGGVLMLGLEGRFVIGDPVEEFRVKVDQAIKGGKTLIGLDFGRTEYIDSSGMGYLVVAHRVASDAGGKLGMYNLTDRVVDLMLLTKLSGVFHLYATESDAVAGIEGKDVEKLDLIAYVHAKGEHAEGGE
jgi:anti-sigma B factor antagonist